MTEYRPYENCDYVAHTRAIISAGKLTTMQRQLEELQEAVVKRRKSNTGGESEKPRNGTHDDATQSLKGNVDMYTCANVHALCTVSHM
jgi:hypothetical protein